MQTFNEWFIEHLQQGFGDQEPPEEIMQQRLFMLSTEVMTFMGSMAGLVFADHERIMLAYQNMLQAGLAQALSQKALAHSTAGTLQ